MFFKNIIGEKCLPVLTLHPKQTVDIYSPKQIKLMTDTSV